ncbi:ABC transporter permease [Acuticoccus sediminis]|uniref:ABC transporter permease n=1 Tax=Acuticoccus sediminis TaxID=2184697 RepID=A0A8B2NXV2_9HYPH|nr:ABC transporter permease [Acuticoccus sediminis]RAI04193.1 ABC transporter permease [Acuticoccus sediminis]
MTDRPATEDAAETRPAASPLTGARARALVAAYGTAVGGLLVFLVFALAADNFLTVGNQFTILRQVSFLVVFSVGFTFALTTSELDLSFAAVASLAGVVCGGLVHHGYPWPLAVVAALAIGGVFGLANGLFVTRAKIPSLIATLATASIATGTAFALTEGVAWVGRWDKSFLWLGRGHVGGVPVLVVWMVVIALAAFFVMRQTRFGVWLTATGQADEAARLAGIPIRSMKVWGLALSGLFAGLGAVLLTASLSSAGPTSADDFLMKGIAAVLLGMTMFEPGRPNVPGTVVGALVIGVLSNGLVLLGAAYYVQEIVLGLIILASVALSASVLTKAAFTV